MGNCFSTAPDKADVAAEQSQARQLQSSQQQRKTSTQQQSAQVKPDNTTSTLQTTKPQQQNDTTTLQPTGKEKLSDIGSNNNAADNAATTAAVSSIEPKTTSSSTTGTTNNTSTAKVNENVLIHEDPNSTQTSNDILAKANQSNNNNNNASSTLQSSNTDQRRVIDSTNTTAQGETAQQIRSDTNYTADQTSSNTTQNAADINTNTATSSQARPYINASDNRTYASYRVPVKTVVENQDNMTGVAPTSSDATTIDFNKRYDSTTTSTNSSSTGTGILAAASGAAAAAVGTASAIASKGVESVKQAVSGSSTATASSSAYDASAHNPRALDATSTSANTSSTTPDRDIQGNTAAQKDDNAQPSYGDASSTGVDSTNTGSTQVKGATGKDFASTPDSDGNNTTAATATAAGTSAVAGSSTTVGSSTTRAKIYIVYYSTYTHVRQLAEAVQKGVEQYGADVRVFQAAETLPKEVLTKMHAPAKSSEHPVITPTQLAEADGLIFGFPTRFGEPAAQMKALLDSTGQLWAKGALLGKPATVFFSTSTVAGGQETTAWTFITQLVHHGMLYVPIGYSNPSLFSEELHGGSPYGAGTYAGSDGSRQPSTLELGVAETEGQYFAQIATALKIGRQHKTSNTQV